MQAQKKKKGREAEKSKKKKVRKKKLIDTGEPRGWLGDNSKRQSQKFISSPPPLFRSFPFLFSSSFPFPASWATSQYLPHLYLLPPWIPFFTTCIPVNLPLAPPSTPDQS